MQFKFKNYKIILAVSCLVLILVGYFIYARVEDSKQNPNGIWETLVVLRSQESGASPEEDAKNSLKRGDVIAVEPEHHEWSETEYKSYLLVKIEGRKNEVEKLLLPSEIRARRYAIDMTKINFSGNQVINGQPVENLVFKLDVIKEK